MSAFLDRIVARTLDAPIIHRRREPLFAGPPDSARRESADDEFDGLGDEREAFTSLVPSTDTADEAHRTSDRMAIPSGVPGEESALGSARDIAPPTDARGDEPRGSADASDRGRSQLGRLERSDVARPQSATAEHAVEGDVNRFNTEAFAKPHPVSTPSSLTIDPRPEAALPSADTHVPRVDAEIVSMRQRSARSDEVFGAVDSDDVKSIERRTFDAPGEPVGGDANRRSMPPEFVELPSRQRDRSVRADNAARSGLDDTLTINVSIGRIDVGHAAPASAPPTARPAQPRPTLGDYMRLREKIRAR